MQRARNFRLPGQLVNDLMQLNRHFEIAQRFSARIEQFEVGDQAQGVGHRDHALLDLHPIPGDSGRQFSRWRAPQSLTAAAAVRVAERQHARSHVNQVQIGRGTGLPQYGRPSVHNPCGRHRGVRGIDGFSFSVFISAECGKASAACHLSTLPGCCLQVNEVRMKFEPAGGARG